MDAVINFFKEFSSMLPTIKVMDIVDILVVAFLIYKVIMMVRSTSAARIAKSVLIILILAGVTQLLNMYLLNYILDKILEIGLVALIVVFQPELRRMLEKLGSKNVREILSVKEEQREIDRVIEQTVQACEIMAKERTGVLIVFERSIPLLEYQKSGTVVDACVSSELLRNLFFTKASLHDGAVIIRNDRIAAAGCVLPLTENHNISSDLDLGLTRNLHRFSLLADNSYFIRITLESCTRIPQRIQNDKIEILFLHLQTGIHFLVIGFESKTHQTLSGSFSSSQLCRYIGIRSKPKNPVFPCSFQFHIAYRFGSIISDGRTHDRYIRPVVLG